MSSVIAFTACGGEPEEHVNYDYFRFTYDESLQGLVLEIENKSKLPSGAITLPAYSYYYANGSEEETDHEKFMPVRKIADGAFEYIGTLTTVVIPTSYTELGAGAFANCKNLTSVTLSPNIEVISDNAFDGCLALTSVLDDNSDTIIAGVKEIGDNAFASCMSLRELDFTYEEDFTVGDRAFFYAITLRSYDVRNASYVGANAFEGWQSTQTVNYDSTSGWSDDWNVNSDAEFKKV